SPLNAIETAGAPKPACRRGKRRDARANQASSSVGLIRFPSWTSTVRPRSPALSTAAFSRRCASPSAATFAGSPRGPGSRRGEDPAPLGEDHRKRYPEEGDEQEAVSTLTPASDAC